MWLLNLAIFSANAVLYTVTSHHVLARSEDVTNYRWGQHRHTSGHTTSTLGYYRRRATNSANSQTVGCVCSASSFDHRRRQITFAISVRLTQELRLWLFLVVMHSRFCDSCACKLFATTKKCGICRHQIDLLLPVFNWSHYAFTRTAVCIMYLELKLTSFNCCYNWCSATFIWRFHYSAFLPDAGPLFMVIYLPLLLLFDISMLWSLVDVSVIRHIQSLAITLRFSYSAFPSPV